MVKKIFYASAEDDKPYVRINSLKQGKYHEVYYYSLRTFIRFTDIGKLLWENMKNMGYDPVIELVKTSMMEEDKGWTVFMFCQGLGILVKSQRYNHFGKYPKSFFLTIEMEGEEQTIRGFVKKTVNDMGYKPWGELDWDSLKKKTDLDRKDAIKTWSECLVRGSVRLAVDNLDVKSTEFKDDPSDLSFTDKDAVDPPPKRRRRRRIS